jgi:hypothetical protein
MDFVNPVPDLIYAQIYLKELTIWLVYLAILEAICCA